MMPGRRPEKLLARAVEPPATTGPTTATGSFCKAGVPSNPVLTVTTRLAGITETPVAATASPLPTGAATEKEFDPDWGEEGGKTSPRFALRTAAATGTVFDPDWGEEGEEISPRSTGNTVVAPEDEPLVKLEEKGLIIKLSAPHWPTPLSRIHS